MRSLALIPLALSFALSHLIAQDAAHASGKPTPAKIDNHLMIVEDSVVTEQWAHTLKLVNTPQNVTLLNPGQCIRVGIVSTGDNRDAFLQNTKLSFRVNFAGQTLDHPLAALVQTKQIKPEGGDFVTAALAAADIKNPLLTMASLGVSADRWCVPDDAGDAIATVEGEAESPSGHQTLKPSTIQVESFETGSKKTFKSLEDLGNFTESYYRQPNPARLVPALQFVIQAQAANQKTDIVSNAAAFLFAALKADPVAANDFLRRIVTQQPMTRALGLLILHSAAYDVSSVLKTLSAEDQQKVQSLPPLANPYDLTPTREIFGHLDLMWSTFEATGQFEPVKTIASVLGWRQDYEDFDAARKAPDDHLTLTPSVVRGVAYTAAGWSLGSFQRNDPLVADYIEYMLASPDTPPIIKSELAGLSGNPAFKQTSGR